jgi:hypothetical protein
MGALAAHVALCAAATRPTRFPRPYPRNLSQPIVTIPGLGDRSSGWDTIERSLKHVNGYFAEWDRADHHAQIPGHRKLPSN